MSTMMLQLVGIALASNADHQPKIAGASGLHSGNGIFEHNGPPGLDPKKSRRQQERLSVVR